MSKIAPPCSAASKVSALVAVGSLLALMMLAAQWRLPALPVKIPLAVLTLIVCGFALLLLRLARHEATLAAMLRQEISRRDAAETALRQARNMAAVGRLTRGLAHDFNNHLTAVSSNIELLARHLPSDAGSLPRLADAAIQGVRRAALLSHHLLSLSRKDSVEPEPLDLSRVIGGMLTLLQRTLGETIVIETVLAEGLWPAWADAHQMEWALLDLLLNARDALPAAGGTVRIETANVSGDTPAGPGDRVLLAVSCDAGAPDAGAATAVAGATVRISHLPGQRIATQLYLPRYCASPASRAAKSIVAGESGTILFVEDDDQVRLATANALRELGYEVLEAPDAMEGFRLVADRGGIDLLFTDIGLPGGVDGKALAHAARNMMPELKVLFTTGYSRGAGAAEEANGALFLAKPFGLDELAAKVREALPIGTPAAALALGQS